MAIGSEGKITKQGKLRHRTFGTHLTELRGLYNNQIYVKLSTIKLIPLLNDTLQATQQGRKFMMHFAN
jgi:hypothetical protein